MTQSTKTDVLIIGAGPFGLSLAAYLGHFGIDHRIVGEPMGFWRDNMPRGMLLRSGLDWHLDALGERTLEAFVAERGLSASAVQPITLELYLDYVRWFQERSAVRPQPTRVAALRRGDGGFVVDGDGSSIIARNVIVATGFRNFAHVPSELAAILPDGTYGHTCDVTDLEAFAGKSVLIVGGRQSAFEWAALLADAGARRVDLTYRHDTPAFTESDWSWVGVLMRRTESDPGWYRRLDGDERAELGQRFWAEGRLKLEPWLAPRLDPSIVHLHPQTTIAAAQRLDGGIAVTLSDDTSLRCDFVVLATGYQVDLNRVPFLAAGDLLADIERNGGAPALGVDLQSSVDGLYFTSMAATGDFGPFFAFTVSVTCSTKLIGESLRRRVGQG